MKKMTTLLVVDRNGTIVQAASVVVDGPWKTVFCKDRKTGERCIFVQTAGADPLDSSKTQRIPTKYTQYDGLWIEVK